ncbi:hypothetical protein RZS08_06400, partial [Arthrospira platensis SPKY1]|nr:hypothetical protein [Arthrospira platensis SPKY1]
SFSSNSCCSFFILTNFLTTRLTFTTPPYFEFRINASITSETISSLPVINSNTKAETTRNLTILELQVSLAMAEQVDRQLDPSVIGDDELSIKVRRRPVGSIAALPSLLGNFDGSDSVDI